MWKEKYRIYVKKVDEQHEALFDTVSGFVKLLREDGDWVDKLPKVKETIDFMQKYVVIHFDDEEAYQLRINYPGYKAHKEIHENFKSEVREFANKFENENFDETLANEFAGKLMAWLINHVASSDQKIGEYAKTLGGTH